MKASLCSRQDWWLETTTALFVVRMWFGLHEDYSLTYFPITIWPMQSNPIPPSPALATSSLCVDLCSVERSVMSSCELGCSLYSRRFCMCAGTYAGNIGICWLRHRILLWFLKYKLLYNRGGQVFQILYTRFVSTWRCSGQINMWTQCSDLRKWNANCLKVRAGSER